MRRSSSPVCVASLLLQAVTGCTSQALLASDFTALQTEIAAAHQMRNCAPKDLAIADANLEFVKLEFEQGDTRRAAEHVRIGRTHAKVAAACSAAPAPKAPTVKPRVEPEAITTALEPTAWDQSSTPDRDRDSVADAEDGCPNDPEDLDSYKDSDGCPDMDDDADGIPDGVDRCPRESEDRDSFEDADGCPDLDNDADRVADLQDACPDEPETMNAYNDADGCPDSKLQRVEVTKDQIVIKERINFATNKAVILPESFIVLDEVVLALQDYPNIRIEIGGHTDNVGDDAQNQGLSKGRADAVFEFLLSKGVQALRMTTVGYGETRPVDTNMTESGRLNNRRVEFLIQK